MKQGRNTVSMTEQSMTDEIAELHRQLETERCHSANVTRELERVKLQGEQTRLDSLKADRAALVAQVEAEEDLIVNSLQRRLTQLHNEKLAVEAKLQGEVTSAALLQKKLAELAEERRRLVGEKASLENTLEAEQEFISLKLTKQVEKLAAEKAKLAREKVELARQVGDLSDAVTKTRQEKVDLEAALEAEEEAAVNKLQRQLCEVTSAYRALETRLESLGVSPKADGAPGVDPTTEWVYGRSPSRSSDRFFSSSRHRERSLSVSSSNSMRDTLPSGGGRPSFELYHSASGGSGGVGSGSVLPGLGHSHSQSQPHSGPPTAHQSAASSPDHRRRVAAMNSQAASSLIDAMSGQTL